ncbi:hypothetical protein B2D07_11260 [Desulfococcus multivorans]|nr:hypothetical protein B2D07_11260 [Desulfococcus multivorans]
MTTKRKPRRKTRKQGITRGDIQRFRRDLWDFRWHTIIVAEWVHRKKELVNCLEREADVLAELWRTMPDDVKKQFNASKRRIERALRRSFLFPLQIEPVSFPFSIEKRPRAKRKL